MKTFSKHLPALALSLPLLAVAAFSSANGGFYASVANAGYGGNTEFKQTFTSYLSGPQEVPTVISSSTANAIFSLAKDEAELEYSVTLNSSTTITGANLYCASRKSNGPEVVALYSSTASSTPGSFTGTITQSDILSTAQACNPSITTVPQLASAVRAGTIYINVLTALHPAGEIRGQVNTAGGGGNGNGGVPNTNYHPVINPHYQLVTPSQQIQFTGRIFAPSENVVIKLNNVVVGSVQADVNGNFTTASMTAPLVPGTYAYTFTGAVSNIPNTSTVRVQ